MKKQLFTLSILLLTLSANAQQISTLYFLDNAPMRHLINPAFQPVSNGYLNFTPLGYTSLSAGNNRLTLSDMVYKDPISGKTVTVFHPDYGKKTQFLNTVGNYLGMDVDGNLDLLSFGFRYKEKGYIYIGVMEKIDACNRVPGEVFRLAFDGSNKDWLNPRTYDFTSLAMQGNAYMEISGGYSHIINEHWTVGGKAKFLLGQLYAGGRFSDLEVISAADALHYIGYGDLGFAGPVQLPAQLDYNYFEQQKPFNSLSISDYLKPNGYGAAFDLGMAYKPIKQVQITAAITDLGFICWKGQTYKMAMDTIYEGIGEKGYSDIVTNNTINMDSVLNDVKNGLINFAKGIHATQVGTSFTRMTRMRLNVGVDANFLDNLLGVGVLSRTQLYNGKLYEEVTIGGAVRPCNWFNFALSYSLVENGKYSNFGAGLSFMPYDGVNMTLACDYIPTVYADYQTKDGKNVAIPYKTQGFNVALGFSIVWGTNKRDSDKDGVYDKIDMCPHTPKNVEVDQFGCPKDSDGDGVPDYLDNCPGTTPAAYGFVDSVGCPLDTDGDGVPDYLDQCSNTPEMAIGYVDSVGCLLDTDGDGVPDYLDQCPNTPAQAIGYVDSIGCELDTDNDGVPDWRDQCPNTPLEAIGLVDSLGCEIDSDGDSVPDWKDLCPNTPAQARGFVDEHGCELDRDSDGVADWQDQCPTIAGPAYNSGCPEVKKEVRTLLTKAMQGIQFETGKATIKKVSFPLLNQIAATFVENVNYVIEVQGHTDNVGKEDFNKKLSQERAESVMKYLVEQGVPQARISAHGYGMEMPIDDNKTKAGRAKNRRVEFKITFEEVSYETILEHVNTELYQEYQDSLKRSVTDTIQ